MPDIQTFNKIVAMKQQVGLLLEIYTRNLAGKHDDRFKYPKSSFNSRLSGQAHKQSGILNMALGY